jgi:hypothetical protein
MATSTTVKSIVAAPSDAIRIVPMHGTEEPAGVFGAAPAAPAGHVTYRGGALLQAVEVFTIFWGTAWQKGQQAQLAQQLNHFFEAILKSALIDQLKEYKAPGKTIGHGKHVGTATVTKPAVHRSTSDAAVRHFLQQEISTNAAFPQPSPNTLYFVYLPPGVSVSMGGGRSCFNFCGYHDSISGQIFYAVMPYAGCNGCTGGLSALDALTETSSHELCEAITDPIPGQGWYDDHYGEIGDLCGWKSKTVGNYTVQQEWSQKAGKCV